MSEERDPKDLAESAIDRADRARERDNESAFVSSYLKRDR